MQAFESEYGRESIRVDDAVPIFQIDWILNRVHVGTPDDDIESNFRGRLARADMAHPKQLADDVIRYALWRHAENGAEYRWVIGGH